MRGLKHNVIEINDPDNANIDRILVFLKPQAEKVTVAATRTEAHALLQQLDIKNIKPKKSIWFKLLVMGAIITFFSLLLVFLL